MARDRSGPPSLGQLLAQGVVEQAANLLAGLVEIGDLAGLNSLAQDILATITVPLFPSTFAALLKRVVERVAGIWEDVRQGAAVPLPIEDIPIDPDRSGKAGDYPGRILYRVIIDVPTTDGNTTPRTVYIDSQIALTFEQIREAALAALQTLIGQFHDRYEEIADESLHEASMTIDYLSRSY